MKKIFEFFINTLVFGSLTLSNTYAYQNPIIKPLKDNNYIYDIGIKEPIKEVSQDYIPKIWEEHDASIKIINSIFTTDERIKIQEEECIIDETGASLCPSDQEECSIPVDFISAITTGSYEDKLTKPSVCKGVSIGALCYKDENRDGVADEIKIPFHFEYFSGQTYDESWKSSGKISAFPYPFPYEITSDNLFNHLQGSGLLFWGGNLPFSALSYYKNAISPIGVQNNVVTYSDNGWVVHGLDGLGDGEFIWPYAAKISDFDSASINAIGDCLQFLRYDAGSTTGIANSVDGYLCIDRYEKSFSIPLPITGKIVGPRSNFGLTSITTLNGKLAVDYKNNGSISSENNTITPVFSCPGTERDGSCYDKEVIERSCEDGWTKIDNLTCTKTVTKYQYGCPEDYVEEIGFQKEGFLEQPPATNKCYKKLKPICPIDNTQTCTRVVLPGAESKINHFNNLIFTNGSSYKTEKTIYANKKCNKETEVYSSLLDKCVETPRYACEKQGFVYNESVNGCVKNLACEGNLVNGVCENPPVITCPEGYYFDSQLQKCAISPVCEIGEYDFNTHACITEISDQNCPSGFSYSKETGKCSKLLTWENNCQRDFIYNKETGKCEKKLAYEDGCQIINNKFISELKHYPKDAIKSYFSFDKETTLSDTFGGFMGEITEGKLVKTKSHSVPKEYAISLNENTLGINKGVLDSEESFSVAWLMNLKDVNNQTLLLNDGLEIELLNNQIEVFYNNKSIHSSIPAYGLKTGWNTFVLSSDENKTCVFINGMITTQSCQPVTEFKCKDGWIAEYNIDKGNFVCKKPASTVSRICESWELDAAGLSQPIPDQNGVCPETRMVKNNYAKIYSTTTWRLNAEKTKYTGTTEAVYFDRDLKLSAPIKIILTPDSSTKILDFLFKTATGDGVKTSLDLNYGEEYSVKKNLPYYGYTFTGRHLSDDSIVKGNIMYCKSIAGFRATDIDIDSYHSCKYYLPSFSSVCPTNTRDIDGKCYITSDPDNTIENPLFDPETKNIYYYPTELNFLTKRPKDLAYSDKFLFSYNGDIDDLFFLNRVLSKDEVTDLHDFMILFKYNNETKKCERPATISPTCDDGFIYNSFTQRCEKNFITKPSCLDGFIFDDKTKKCTKPVIADKSCPIGFSYNIVNGLCEKPLITKDSCEIEGFSYDYSLKRCEKLMSTKPICPEGFVFSKQRDRCEKKLEYIPDCKEGYVFNSERGRCEKALVVAPSCRDGFVFNTTAKRCEKALVVAPSCRDGFTWSLERERCEKPLITKTGCTNGYIYNPAKDRCEKDLDIKDSCPSDFHWNNITKKCEKDLITKELCKEGYIFNKNTKRCEKDLIVAKACDKEGFTYNHITKRCEKELDIKEGCPSGYIFNLGEKRCEKELLTEIPCNDGYSYNPAAKKCEKELETSPGCPEGFSYNQTTNNCIKALNYIEPCRDGYKYNKERNRCEKDLEVSPGCDIGFTYNPIEKQCEKSIETSDPCPNDYAYDKNENICKKVLTTEPVCPEGFIYDKTGKCLKKPTLYPFCADGYTYNESSNSCIKLIQTQNPTCEEGYLYNEEKNRCEKNIPSTKPCPETFVFNNKTKKCEIDLNYKIAEYKTLYFCSNPNYNFVSNKYCEYIGDNYTAKDFIMKKIKENEVVKSCSELKKRFPDLKTGDYLVAIDDTHAIKAKCDMEYQGGGWMLVYSAKNNDADPLNWSDGYSLYDDWRAKKFLEDKYLPTTNQVSFVIAPWNNASAKGVGYIDVENYKQSMEFNGNLYTMHDFNPAPISYTAYYGYLNYSAFFSSESNLKFSSPGIKIVPVPFYFPVKSTGYLKGTIETSKKLYMNFSVLTKGEFTLLMSDNNYNIDKIEIKKNEDNSSIFSSTYDSDVYTKYVRENLNIGDYIVEISLNNKKDYYSVSTSAYFKPDETPSDVPEEEKKVVLTKVKNKISSFNFYGWRVSNLKSLSSDTGNFEIKTYINGKRIFNANNVSDDYYDPDPDDDSYSQIWIRDTNVSIVSPEGGSCEDDWVFKSGRSISEEYNNQNTFFDSICYQKKHIDSTIDFFQKKELLDPCMNGGVFNESDNRCYIINPVTITTYSDSANNNDNIDEENLVYYNENLCPDGFYFDGIKKICIEDLGLSNLSESSDGSLYVSTNIKCDYVFNNETKECYQNEPNAEELIINNEVFLTTDPKSCNNLDGYSYNEELNICEKTLLEEVTCGSLGLLLNTEKEKCYEEIENKDISYDLDSDLAFYKLECPNGQTYNIDYNKCYQPVVDSDGYDFNTNVAYSTYVCPNKYIYEPNENICYTEDPNDPRYDFIAKTMYLDNICSPDEKYNSQYNICYKEEEGSTINSDYTLLQNENYCSNSYTFNEQYKVCYIDDTNGNENFDIGKVTTIPCKDFSDYLYNEDYNKCYPKQEEDVDILFNENGFLAYYNNPCPLDYFLNENPLICYKKDPVATPDFQALKNFIPAECGKSLTGAGINKIYASCLGIKKDNPAASNGIYIIDPDGSQGNAPIEVYCDMDSETGWYIASEINCDSGQIWDFKNKTCIENPLDANQCDKGFTYNSETDRCEKEVFTQKSCFDDLVYNPETERCEKTLRVLNGCPSGYTYNSSENTCIYRNSDISLCSGLSGSPSYNSSTGKCENTLSRKRIVDCGAGWTYSVAENKCSTNFSVRSNCPDGWFESDVYCQRKTSDVIMPTNDTCPTGYKFSSKLYRCYGVSTAPTSVQNSTTLTYDNNGQYYLSLWQSCSSFFPGTYPYNGPYVSSIGNTCSNKYLPWDATISGYTAYTDTVCSSWEKRGAYSSSEAVCYTLDSGYTGTTSDYSKETGPACPTNYYVSGSVCAPNTRYVKTPPCSYGYTYESSKNICYLTPPENTELLWLNASAPIAISYDVCPDGLSIDIETGICYTPFKNSVPDSEESVVYKPQGVLSEVLINKDSDDYYILYPELFDSNWDYYAPKEICYQKDDLSEIDFDKDLYLRSPSCPSGYVYYSEDNFCYLDIDGIMEDLKSLKYYIEDYCPDDENGVNYSYNSVLNKCYIHTNSANEDFNNLVSYKEWSCLEGYTYSKENNICYIHIENSLEDFNNLVSYLKNTCPVGYTHGYKAFDRKVPDVNKDICFIDVPESNIDLEHNIAFQDMTCQNDTSLVHNVSEAICYKPIERPSYDYGEVTFDFENLVGWITADCPFSSKPLNYIYNNDEKLCYQAIEETIPDFEKKVLFTEKICSEYYDFYEPGNYCYIKYSSPIVSAKTIVTEGIDGSKWSSSNGDNISSVFNKDISSSALLFPSAGSFSIDLEENKNFYADWSFKLFENNFKIAFELDTKFGKRRIVYWNGDTSDSGKTKYFHLNNTQKDKWLSFQRDLTIDLKNFERENSIAAISKISFEGSGFIDSFYLKGSETIEDFKDKNYISPAICENKDLIFDRNAQVCYEKIDEENILYDLYSTPKVAYKIPECAQDQNSELKFILSPGLDYCFDDLTNMAEQDFNTKKHFMSKNCLEDDSYNESICFNTIEGVETNLERLMLTIDKECKDMYNDYYEPKNLCYINLEFSAPVEEDFDKLIYSSEFVCSTDTHSYNKEENICYLFGYLKGSEFITKFIGNKDVTEEPLTGSLEYNFPSRRVMTDPSCGEEGTLSFNKCSYLPVCKDENASFVAISDICAIEGEKTCKDPFVMTSSGTCISTTLCPNDTMQSDNFCISDATPVCDPDQVLMDGKCASDPFCETGFLENRNNCSLEYSYYNYTCDNGLTATDKGNDCLGACGYYGCSCNNETPPANNCRSKKEQEDNEILKRYYKDIAKPFISGDLWEIPEQKDYACGKDCSFSVFKIEGDGSSLCFTKGNNEKKCLTVPGCYFYGKIKQNSPISNLKTSGLYKIVSDTQSISSNCLINGYIGGDTLGYGFDAIDMKKNTISFINSYKEGSDSKREIGFFSFLPEISNENAKDGYYYENFHLSSYLKNGGFIKNIANYIYLGVPAEYCSYIKDNFGFVDIDDYDLKTNDLLYVFNKNQNTCILKKVAENYFEKDTNNIEKLMKTISYLPGDEKYFCSPWKCSDEGTCAKAICPPGFNISTTILEKIIEENNMEYPDRDKICIDEVCDANKDYFPLCGQDLGCDTKNPNIFETTKDGETICLEYTCKDDEIFDLPSKKCKQYVCPPNSKEINGKCVGK